MANKLSKKQIDTLLANMPKSKQAINAVDNTTKAKPRPEENPVSKEAMAMFMGQLQRNSDSKKRFINDAGPAPVYKNVGEKVRADLERESRQRDLMASIPNEKFNTWVENVGMPVADAAMIAEGGMAIPKLLEKLGPKLSKETIETISKNSNKNIGAIEDYMSDKDREMYEYFKEKQRFDKLPNTNNKNSLSVLDDFIERINTPEGKKRMKELGIKNNDLLKSIKIKEDLNSFGYYKPSSNAIAIHPNDDLIKQTTRHEIEHGVQNAVFNNKKNPEKLTEIDNLLSDLELKKESSGKIFDNVRDRNSPVDIYNMKNLLSNKQNATDYFLSGSDGNEKSAFLSEVQQYMMDNKIIPNKNYVKITPQMVKNTHVDAMFDEEGGGKYLRLFNIMKSSDKNYKLIADGLNKMLGISGAAVGSKILSDKTIETLKKKKNG